MGRKKKEGSMLPSLKEGADGEESIYKRPYAGINCRPPGRPRNSYSRGSVDPKKITRVQSSASLEEIETTDCLFRAGVKTTQGSRKRDSQESSDEEMTESGWETDLEGDEPEDTFDITGKSTYVEACKAYGVVPISYFLRFMNEAEVSMMHHGLGPQGAKAIAVCLVTNTTIVKLNLKDNSLEGDGGRAMAAMLKENCYITEIDLSDNKLGVRGAKGIASMLKENISLVKLVLSGNNFEDQAAKYVAKGILFAQKLEILDLSHNKMGDLSGEVLGSAIAQNICLQELNLSWNHVRGAGSVAIAIGLGGNIVLKVIDLSYNGFEKDGASALGDALKVNFTLVELNVSHNRIGTEGAIAIAMGLKENTVLKVLNISYNPMQGAGCYGVLKVLQDNPKTAMESLDFSGITVNKDFLSLLRVVKQYLPDLEVTYDGNEVVKVKSKAPPIEKLKSYMKENDLEVMNFLEKVDLENTSINLQEFQDAVKNVGVPLSDTEHKQLMDFLDKDKDGEIRFSVLNELLKS
ncbi:leucine-rich repeat-containing protein 74B [Callorhinchus milii]|nr:leucine-rich repeat-containing protein 74B [Callorhinchus milii]|eukprot:gi/632967501/ref/XP_007900014.1/ PREDICTED: leucine-rich repeat-containing protein-like isoform X2 [Callorhinchus milii]